MIAFQRTGPAVTETDVAKFESTLTAPLPADYRHFLLITNGGWLVENWWPPEVSAADFDVDVIYSLGDVDFGQSLTGVKETFDGRIPGSFLAVGNDSNGNQLCLALSAEEGHGSVWFFNHELETEPDDEAYPGLLTRVCGSFTELLNTIQPLPETTEMARRIKAARPGVPLLGY